MAGRDGASGGRVIARQLSEACGWEPVPRYIIRDRDSVYGEVFKRQLRAMGIRDRPTPPRSPWQNGHTERLIGSIRRECLDHIVVFGEQHLRHLLHSYMAYYNGARTHLSLDKDAPVPRTVHAIGRILPTPILGGLHHHYNRIRFPTWTGVVSIKPLADSTEFLLDRPTIAGEIPAEAHTGRPSGACQVFPIFKIIYRPGWAEGSVRGRDLLHEIK
jgi:Integrase core domain